MTDLKWQKHYPLSDKNAYICLADTMGDDTTIAERAFSRIFLSNQTNRLLLDDQRLV